MNLKILQATPNPIEVISLAAGTCYGKRDVSEKRVRNCVKSGHHSVLEHAAVTFEVDGISRACSHQLVRHRLASYSQQSQRYCKVDTNSRDWYVVPPEVTEVWTRADFDSCMVDCAQAYRDALDDGIKPEDARYLLPEATKTVIMVSMNVRELFHFLSVRQGRGAQWEIRDLAEQLEKAVYGINDEWASLIEMRGEWQ